jgi:hypothetical protein
MIIENGKTYVGIVENNNDPKKLGRIKARIMDVFDDTNINDIPWASPWKDLSGDEFKIPDTGKVVTIIFENANINEPEYIFSDNYNINLEKKLSQLSESDYLSTKSLIFDHKTQIYVNDSEGLKIDHKFNIINIKDKSIDIKIKDNYGKINLGTANSTQRIILGDNFLNWFDNFVNILMGGNGGPFLGNLGAPVLSTPAMLECLSQYQQMKDPKFLSNNIYAVDNDNVEILDRIADSQIGDMWKSNVKNNDITSKESIDYKPIEGTSDTTFDQPPINAYTQSNIAPSIVNYNNDIDILIELLYMKNYKLYEDIDKLNIIAIRNQCQNIGDKYTDQFIDKLYVLFKNSNNKWQLKQYIFSTVPGLKFTITNNWLSEKNLTNSAYLSNLIGKNIYMKDYMKEINITNNNSILKNGLPILVPSQYIDVYYISQYRGSKSFSVIPGANQLVWRDNDTTNISTFNPNNWSTPELITPNNTQDNGIKLHLGYPSGKKVGNWSEGAQVFSNSENLNEFFELCEIHKSKYGNVFSYTLATKDDFNEASKNIENNI